MGDAIPRLAVLGSMRKEAEQDIGIKPASSLSIAYSWLLCASLEPFHKPEFLSMFSAYCYASGKKNFKCLGTLSKLMLGIPKSHPLTTLVTS